MTIMLYFLQISAKSFNFKTEMHNFFHSLSFWIEINIFLPQDEENAPYGAIDGWDKPTLFMDLPPYTDCKYGTFIQSAIPSNKDISIPQPLPVFSLTNKAWRIAECAFKPHAISHTETPTLPGLLGSPVMLHRPDSACTNKSYAFLWL